jgi:hypothetical protein
VFPFLLKIINNDNKKREIELFINKEIFYLFKKNKRKTPRIKADKDRTSKRYNLQQNSSELPALVNNKIITTTTTTTPADTTKSSLPLSPNKTDETSIDERLDKKRREREL